MSHIPLSKLRTKGIVNILKLKIYDYALAYENVNGSVLDDNNDSTFLIKIQVI